MRGMEQKNQIMKVVHVAWLDSMSNCEWSYIDEIEDTLKLTHSVGFLVKETDNSLVLALSLDPQTHSVHSFKHIPIVAIDEVRELCHIEMISK